MTVTPSVIVVGAGAAGLLAAARLGEGALLLDANPKPGKKLLATGNGRCNLTHDPIDPAHYHGDVSAAAPLLAAFSATRVREEFRTLGLLTRPDSEGRCYPNSLQAASVLQALWAACEESGVATRWEARVTALTRGKAGFTCTLSTGETFTAPRVVLATGGKASPQHGGGRGYDLARSLGHTVTPLTPSLTPLRTPDKLCRALKGQRCRAQVTLTHGGEALYTESGEVIFGDGQLSGICVFDLSARLREQGFTPGAPGWAVTLDPLPDLSLPDLTAYLTDLACRRPSLPAGELFSGAMNLRLGSELVKRAGLPRELPASQLSPAQLELAARTAKAVTLPITGPGDWDSAQVTAGGVPLAQVDPRTLESRKCPGLYLLGELLDLDGDCGGYNLHWAWATALAAAEAIRHA